MRILGVIDLAGGHAVHARGGNRAEYAPVRKIAGRAIQPGDALALAESYQDLFGIDELYVADLDAITTGRPQLPLIARLTRRARIWLDAGIATRPAAARAVDTGAERVIVGLETLRSFDDLATICAGIGQAATVFSLDLRNGRALCPPNLLAAATPIEAVARTAAAAGVRTMMLIDVARVGSHAGPDVEAIQRVRHGAPDVHLVAGGGLRGLADVMQVAASGCDGVLIATALQDGRMTAGDVAAARILQPSVSR